MVPRSNREEVEARRAVVRAAGRGQEVSILLLPLVESRTHNVMGQEFLHWREVAARAGQRSCSLSICGLPMFSPIGRPYRMW